jgi:hypothetical protein
MRRQVNERQGGTSVHGAPPIGRLYDVDGRSLLLHHSGARGPAVVFAPGAGLIGLDYLNIHDQVSTLRGLGNNWTRRIPLYHLNPYGSPRLTWTLARSRCRV